MDTAIDGVMLIVNTMMLQLGSLQKSILLCNIVVSSQQLRTRLGEEAALEMCSYCKSFID